MSLIAGASISSETSVANGSNNIGTCTGSMRSGVEYVKPPKMRYKGCRAVQVRNIESYEYSNEPEE